MGKIILELILEVGAELVAKLIRYVLEGQNK